MQLRKLERALNCIKVRGKIARVVNNLDLLFKNAEAHILYP